MPPKFTEIAFTPTVKVECDRPDLIAQLHTPGYPADPQRAILIHIEAWDWNCPQHIPT